jgi:hypothetical protein
VEEGRRGANRRALLKRRDILATVGTDRLTGFFRCRRTTRKVLFCPAYFFAPELGADCFAAEADNPLAFYGKP